MMEFTPLTLGQPRSDQASGNLKSNFEVLQHLLRLHLDHRLGDFSSLPLTPDFITCATYFILAPPQLQDPETPTFRKSVCVEPFITTTLTRLLHQLNRSSEQRQELYHGQVRGKVQWDATYKARYSGDFDRTIFVCREVHHRYDTPENQLLKFVIEEIGKCIRAIQPIIRAGFCYIPYQSGLEVTDEISTQRRLERMEGVLRRLHRNVRIREVKTPARIDEFHLLRAETSRLEEYALVASLYRLYQRLVIQPTWEALQEIGDTCLPLPANLDGDGLRWVELSARFLRATA